MTTRLTKPIWRETAELKSDDQRPMIAGLVPGDRLVMRPKGTRRVYQLALADALECATLKNAPDVESDAVVRDAGKLRRIMTRIIAGDVIEFRPKGTQQRYQLNVIAAFEYALQLEGRRIRREKAAAKKGGHK